MNRRRFLATAPAGAALAAAAPELVKPRALRPGDTVGLITPSTYVADPDRLWLARRTIEELGLRCKMGRFVGRREGYLGGTVRERVEDLHAMFADPEVKAVFCIRGGYGAAMLLDSIDYGLIRRNPKIFAGYSDITALHLAIHRMARLVTFHGPVVLSGLSDFTLEHFRRALFETKPLGRLANPPEPRPIRPRHPWRAVRPGRARGPLAGGNLTLISATLGTPYEIETDASCFWKTWARNPTASTGCSRTCGWRASSATSAASSSANAPPASRASSAPASTPPFPRARWCRTSSARWTCRCCPAWSSATPTISSRCRWG
jgi:muramoyltetrapeptide carboxypeptidase